MMPTTEENNRVQSALMHDKLMGLRMDHAVSETTKMTRTFSAAQIKHLTDQFLRWRLPANFAPDGGVTFEPTGNAGTQHEYRREPTGTNLLTAEQAEKMVLFMLDGLPD